MHNLQEDFIKSINEFREEYNQKEKLNVGILVSGGVDSVVLAHVAASVKNICNISIKLLHIEFDDFPSHKKATQIFQDIVNMYQLEFSVFSSNINNKETGIKLLAREELINAAFSEHFDLVATAHHANDQIETILFRLLRGAGPAGLKGMSLLTEFNRDNVIHVRCKPFLNRYKKEILDYAHFNNLEYVHDETNDENNSDRNYIRNEIIPRLDSRFDIKNILVTSNNIQQEIKPIDYINIRIMEGKWAIEEFIKLPILNRTFVIKEYINKTFGYNINRKVYKGICKALSEDLTNLRIIVGNGIEIVSKNGYIKVIKCQ